METGWKAIQRAALGGSASKQQKGSRGTPLKSFLGLVVVNVLVIKRDDQTEQISSHWKGL